MKKLFSYSFILSLFLTISLLISPVVGIRAAEGDIIFQPNDFKAFPSDAKEEIGTDSVTITNSVQECPETTEVQCEPCEPCKPCKPCEEEGDEGEAGKDTNFFFEPRIVTGVLSQKYEEIYEGSENVKWEDNIPFYGMGLTLGYKNFAFDVYAQQSASGKDSLFETNGVLIRDYNTHLSREDYAVNLSYGRNLFMDFDRVVFSVGYKVGQTDISGTRRRIFGGTINYGHEETQFETKGPSIGIDYGFPIGENVFGINLAYALLETAYSSTEQSVDPDSTSGLTVGLLWRGPLVGNLKYSFSVAGYEYVMDAKASRSRLSSIEESVFSVKASLIYSFDF